MSFKVHHVLELCELEGQCEAFLLSLRAEAFDTHLVAELQNEVVLVRADGSVLRVFVGLTGVGELFAEGTSVG